MRYISVLLVCAFFFACGQGQENIFVDQTIQEIYTRQDERSAAHLFTFLQDENPKYRAAAALAFASIQDRSAVDPLLVLLADGDEGVRSAAAYALGQVGAPAAESRLLKAYEKERSLAVRRDILEALGKCGTQTGLEFLTNLSCRKEDGPLLIGQARGIYRFSLRDVVSSQGTQKMLELLSRDIPGPAVITASNYLARLKGIDLTPYHRQLIRIFKNKSSVFLRMNLALALGKAKHPEVLAFLKELLAENHDYRIRVNAVRAIAGFHDSQVIDILFGLSADANVHVAALAAQFFQARGPGAHANRCCQAALQLKDWHPRALMLAAALKFAPGKEAKKSVIDFIISTYKACANVYEQGLLLQALAEDPLLYEFVREQTFSSQQLVVKTYGMTALVAMRRHKDFPQDKEQEFAGIFKEAIQTGDTALVGLACGILQDPALNFKSLYPDTSFLKETLAKLKLPEDIEAYQQLQETIRFFDGKEAAADTPPPTAAKSPIDWQAVTSIDVGQQVIIRTAKGNITIQLLVNESPGSVANFVRLIRQGFYKNNAFHRVVPNFVIQAGCSRGDGWGGARFSIRSEFGPLYYEEGSVGMASAGKDTESSQWFITHSPTPHLDGRYTIFARVISGMKVVHKIDIGERILDIHLVK